MSALEDILTRLCAVQEQVVTGSKAYRDVFVATLNSVYWTNQVDLSTADGGARLGAGAAQVTVTVTMRLHRGKFTENQTDPGLGARCRDDVRAMVAYFARDLGRDLKSTLYPDRYASLVPQSVIYRNGQVTVFEGSDGTRHAGSVHTLTFAYYEIG